MIVWKLDEVLRVRGVKGRELARALAIGENYLSRVRHEVPDRLSLLLLDGLCRELGCGIADLIEYQPGQQPALASSLGDQASQVRQVQVTTVRGTLATPRVKRQPRAPRAEEPADDFDAIVAAALGAAFEAPEATAPAPTPGASAPELAFLASAPELAPLAPTEAAEAFAAAEPAAGAFPFAAAAPPAVAVPASRPVVISSVTLPRVAPATLAPTSAAAVEAAPTQASAPSTPTPHVNVARAADSSRSWPPSPAAAAMRQAIASGLAAPQPQTRWSAEPVPSGHLAAPGTELPPQTRWGAEPVPQAHLTPAPAEPAKAAVVRTGSLAAKLGRLRQRRQDEPG